MRSLLLSLISLSLLASCVSSQPTSSGSSKPSVDAYASNRNEQEVRIALQGLRAKDPRKAVARLQRYLKESPHGLLTDDVNYALGERDFSSQNYAAAYAHFAFVEKYKTFASLRAARCKVLLHQGDDALKILSTRNKQKDTPDQAQEALLIQYEAALQSHKSLDALSAVVLLSDRATNQADQRRYRNMAIDAVETRLSEDEVRQISDSSYSPWLVANAKLRYAGFLLDQRQIPRAKDELSEAVNLAQSSKDTDLVLRAQTLLTQLESRQKTDPRTVGVVLPLSGKQAKTGYATLHGIELGLGIYGKVRSNLKLSVIDSEGKPDAARRGVEKLILEDGAIAIIGGLLSKTAAAEAAKAQELGTPSILLSQKSGLTQVGDSIFRNALTSEMQVQRLVSIAMDQQNYTRFAILYPNNNFGTEYANLFWDEVLARGGQIVGAQAYDPKANDFRPYVQRLSGLYYIEDRWEEYRLALHKWQEKNPKRSVRNSGPTFEDLVGPVQDFDAVFVPDSADALRLIAPTLPLYEVDARLLGTTLWNRPELVEHKNRDIEKAIFVDSPNLNEEDAASTDFYNNYKNVFEEEPNLFSLQAYDSGLILRQILASGESSRLGVQRRLAELKNFPGALGPLTISNQREIMRPTLGFTFHESKIEPLDEETIH